MFLSRFEQSRGQCAPASQRIWRAAVLSLVLTTCVSQAQQTNDGKTAVVSTRPAGQLEVLSDTRGIDFRPYLSDLIKKIKANWYSLIPEEARPPQLTPGAVSIEFAILPDGRVAGMRIVHGSGNTSLDRAAWGGITAGNPFPPLPKQFTGPYLALRFHFFYNPQKLPPEERPAPQQPATASQGPK